MVAAIGLLLAVAASVPVAPSRPRIQLDVVVEAGVDLARDDLRAAASLIADIWRPVLDVDVSFGSGTVQPGIAERLWLTITNRGLEGDDTGLAWVGFRGDEPLTTVTLSMQAVQRLARDGRWHGRALASYPPHMTRLFLQRAVARAVAHEIGHYVLRSRQHERAGLMRAAFSVDDIMDGVPALGTAIRDYARRNEQRASVASAPALAVEPAAGGKKQSEPSVEN
ncbi:MAG: hypothetical protein JSU08_09945 [Acidobacteria bacterium]|nr:hypothetical protein [Acidobacteriota bacterium]